MSSGVAPYRVGLGGGTRDARRTALTGATAAAIVLALTALAAVLRFYHLGHQGLWYDESDTVLLLRFSPGKMIGLIPQTESTPPLYYCVAWAWVRIFGSDAFGVRSLSATAGVLVVPVAYGAAATLVSRRAGIICAALAACNPFLIWYSQEARSYELLVLLCGVSLLCFARVRRDPRGGEVVLWVIASALALGTHYFAALVVVPEAVWLLAQQRRVRSVKLGAVIVALCGIALIPLAISQNGTGNDGWIATEPLRLRLAQVLPQFLLGTDAPVRTVLKFVALAVALVGLCLIARATREQRRGAVLAGGLALVGFVIALVLILFGFDDLITRNLIELWLPAAVALSAGLAAVDARRLGVALCATLCGLGIAATVAVAVDARFQRPDWPGVERVLGDTTPAGQSRAILIQRFQTLLPLSLALPHLAKLHAPAQVTQLDIIAMRSPSQPDCWWGAECNLISSTLQSRYRLAGFSPVGVRHVGQFSILELRAAHPVSLSRRNVSRALTETRLGSDILMVQRGG